jgi:predicted ester cyclase
MGGSMVLAMRGPLTELKGAKNMTTEDNKKNLIRWMETFNSRDLAAIDRMTDEIFSPAWISHTPSSPDQPHDREGWKQMFRAIFTDYPDFHFTFEDLIAVGDKTVARGNYIGTHAVSKEPYNQQFIGISRWSDGKLVEKWELVAPGAW